MGFPGLDCEIPQSILNVFLYRQMGKQGVILVHNAQFPALRRKAGHIQAVDEYAPALEGAKPHQGLQQQGFAGSRGSDQGEKIIVQYAEVDMLQTEAFEPEAEILNVDHRS